MPTPLEDVTRLLAQIEIPGSFATHDTAAPDDLRLSVTGVGRVHLPVTVAQARHLIAVARPARHGFKDQTRLDPRVRDTWEVPKSRIAIDRRAWVRTLGPRLDAIRRDLGLPEQCRLKADLHNLLIYEPGQFFAAHQDSEKSDGMIGSLVVILPSAFAGGEMVIEHHDEQVIVRGSRRRLTLAAFYADCHHQVRAVTRGYRIALTWNLVLAGRALATVSTPAGQIDRLAQHVQRVFETPPARRWANDTDREPPDRLVYLLDHQYTQRSLGWDGLKNGDAVRAAALRAVARRIDCEIVLALADVHETWSCEDEDDWGGGYGSGYRRRRYWREDDEAGGAGAHVLVDLMDSDVELRHWVGSGRRPEAIAAPVQAHELCYTKASHDLEPFQSEHEGYMGNWGNTVDRWYHRAAVVLWPRERTFIIRARASADWALRELARSLDAGDLEGARQMTERLRPFWDRTARAEPRRGFLDRTMRIAARLGDPDLAALLLRPFRLTQLTATASRRLTALLTSYRLAWCRSLLEQWAPDRHENPDGRNGWIALTLPELCGLLCTAGTPDGMHLAQWLVREQWTWMNAQRKQALTHDNPRHTTEALSRLSAPVLALIEGTLIAGESGLQDEIIRDLASDQASSAEARVHLLRAAYERYPRAAWPRLGLGPIHASAAADLAARLDAPARARDDWSIAAAIRCTCRLCGALTTFLRAPGESRLHWPLAKEQRRHVHAMLDAYGLPVTHTTRRSGRPFTLVLEKTAAVFERDAAARRSWQLDRQWLVKTARAFGA